MGVINWYFTLHFLSGTFITFWKLIFMHLLSSQHYWKEVFTFMMCIWSNSVHKKCTKFILRYPALKQYTRCIISNHCMLLVLVLWNPYDFWWLKSLWLVIGFGKSQALLRIFGLRMWDANTNFSKFVTSQTLSTDDVRAKLCAVQRRLLQKLCASVLGDGTAQMTCSRGCVATKVQLFLARLLGCQKWIARQ